MNEANTNNDQTKPLIINGLKRSGNHVIINWLVENLSMNFKNWVNERNQHYHFKPPTSLPLPYQASTIYSFEDITLEHVRTYGISGDIATVGIHRSLDNLISSRIIAFVGNPSVGRPGFVDYADELEGDAFSSRLIEAEAHLISAFHAELSEYSLTIYYDAFITDPQYRIGRLAELHRLGFAVPAHPKEASLENVSEIGFGSSFLPAGQRELNISRYLSRADQLTERQKETFNLIRLAVASKWRQG